MGCIDVRTMMVTNFVVPLNHKFIFSDSVEMQPAVQRQTLLCLGWLCTGYFVQQLAVTIWGGDRLEASHYINRRTSAAAGSGNTEDG